jgi:hypothetical protein
LTNCAVSSVVFCSMFHLTPEVTPLCAGDAAEQMIWRARAPRVICVIRGVRWYSAALGGEQAMVEYWQVRREGGQRGIVEMVPEKA